jgi:hypothetical protein
LNIVSCYNSDPPATQLILAAGWESFASYVCGPFLRQAYLDVVHTVCLKKYL